MLASGEEERTRRQEAHTATQVALSRAAADRDRARERVAQIDADLRKRKIEATNLSAGTHETRGRLAECVLATLRASASQAEAYREKETREHVIAELATQTATDRATLIRDRWHVAREPIVNLFGKLVRTGQQHPMRIGVSRLRSPPDAAPRRVRRARSRL